MKKTLIIIGVLLTSIALLIFGSSGAAAASDDTVTDTTTQECVPEGVEIVDVETGDTYIYNVPGPLGVDSCGNSIPNVCVQWDDGHFSRVWSAEMCEPDTSASETTIPASENVDATDEQMLPETGVNVTLLAVVAGSLVALGFVVLRWGSRTGIR